ncbi:MAG: dephospho-CoA kinase [Cyclobacteriaceae bacterium]|nr:dephospho-CoA kinase [Cyclobacteriaceae bacterium]
MKRPLQIGITGGIGSGKSIICRVFTCLGISVYDADSRAKAVMTTDGILISQIKKEFGGLSYDEQGGLNRQYLAQTVFHDPDKVRILNQLVHPRVKEDYVRWLEDHKQEPYVLKEAALLYEAESDQSLDKIIVVYAPVHVRLKRVLQRDAHRNEEQVKAIMGQQMSDEEKVKRADFVILNDDSKLVLPQVLELHRRFLAGN